MSDALTRQLNWIDTAPSAPEMEARGKIVAWQLVASTINSFIKIYNQIDDPPPSAPQPGSEAMDFTRLALKTILVGQLFELHRCLVAFERYLHGRGISDSKLTRSRRRFDGSVNGIAGLSTIRNSIAFHLGQISMEPADLVSVYRTLDTIPISKLGRVLRHGFEIGQAMKRRIISAS